MVAGAFIGGCTDKSHECVGIVVEQILFGFWVVAHGAEDQVALIGSAEEAHDLVFKQADGCNRAVFPLDPAAVMNARLPGCCGRVGAGQHDREIMGERLDLDQFDLYREPGGTGKGQR